AVVFRGVGPSAVVELFALGRRPRHANGIATDAHRCGRDPEGPPVGAHAKSLLAKLLLACGGGTALGLQAQGAPPFLASLALAFASALSRSARRCFCS